MDYIDPAKRAEVQAKSEQQLGALRNKLSKWADKVQVGYESKHEPERTEGETWEDAHGKTWTVINGIKQTVSKTEGAKMPWWCPACTKTMNKKLDDRFYWLRGTCFDCWITYEGKMRVAKVYDAFERRALRGNEKAWIADLVSQHLDYIEHQSDMEIHFMDGRWEVLAKESEFDEMKEKLQKDIQFMYDRLTVIEREEKEDDQDQRDLEQWKQENPWNHK